MARGRRAEDWDRDLAQARAAEAELAGVLAADDRLEDLEDNTEDYDKLDFAFTYRGLRIQLDLKEKRQPYSASYSTLMPGVEPRNLFIVDETVYRRIVWQGGGGYLLIHDYPEERWAVFGPWELTLGPRVRYQRWGKRGARSFLKGKILLDLSTAAYLGRHFRVRYLLDVIEAAAAARDAVESVSIEGQEVPELGKLA